MTFAERKTMVLAYGYGLSIELIKTYIIKLICKYTLIIDMGFFTRQADINTHMQVTFI